VAQGELSHVVRIGIRTLTRSTLATVVTAAFVVGSVTTAHAQSARVRDKSSDVFDLAAEKGGRDAVLGYADSVASGADLRSMSVKHTQRSISMTLRFADLGPQTEVAIAFRIDGRSKPQFVLTSLSRSKAEIRNAADKRRCTVPLTTTNGPRGTVHVVVERSCLGSPRKIKLGAAASTVTVVEESAEVRLDVLSDTSVRTESFDWTKWIKAS
jgi:hypothetical protein